MNGELSVPPEGLDDENATEVLRAWLAHEKLFCVLKPEGFEDAAAWGILLADVARHIANGLEQARGVDRDETLSRIRLLFNTEFDHPTDEATGQFVN